jgi:hypothetical protein
MKPIRESILIAFIGATAIIMGSIAILHLSNKSQEQNNDDNIKYINVDAKITNVTRGKEFTDVVDTTYIVDIHGHMGKLEGIWGKEGDHLKISCYNGNVFREEITSK